MTEKNPSLPVNQYQVNKYFLSLSTTDEFLTSKQEVFSKDKNRLASATLEQKKSMGRRALQSTLAMTAERLNENTHKYEASDFNDDYNKLLSSLPGLQEGTEALRANRGNARLNKRKVIPFNHAIKNIIDHNRTITPAQLDEMILNTLNNGQFDQSLYNEIKHSIIPGMNHELALESNLFYLPHQPEVIDTTVDDELRGVDYRLRYENGIEITVDCKKSETAAAEAMANEHDWRQQHRQYGPTDHIVIWSGYTKEDFINNQIGCVTDEARKREQPRIDAIITNTYAALTAERVNH